MGMKEWDGAERPIQCETLRRSTTGTVAVNCKPCPSTILTTYRDNRFGQKYCIEMSDMGFGLGKEEVTIMHTAFLIAYHTLVLLIVH